MIQQIRVLLYLISNHVQNCVNEMKSNDKLFALLKIFMANLSLLLISLKSLRYHKTTHKKTTLKYFLSNPMFTKHLWMGYSCSDIIILLSIYFFLLTQSHSPERRNNVRQLSEYHMWRLQCNSLYDTNHFDIKSPNDRRGDNYHPPLHHNNYALKIISKSSHYEINVLVNHFKEKQGLKGGRKDQTTSFYETFNIQSFLSKILTEFELFHQRADFNSHTICEISYHSIR